MCSKCTDSLDEKIEKLSTSNKRQKITLIDKVDHKEVASDSLLHSKKTKDNTTIGKMKKLKKIKKTKKVNSENNPKQKTGMCNIKLHIVLSFNVMFSF